MCIRVAADREKNDDSGLAERSEAKRSRGLCGGVSFGPFAISQGP